MTNAERIEREVEANRANVESTLEKLKGRMSIDQIVDDVGHFIGLDNARGTLQTAGRQVRENPLAIGLIGVGLAWLLLGPNEKTRDRADAYTPYGGNTGEWDRDYRQRDSNRGSLTGAVQHAAGSVRAATGNAMSRTQHAVTDAKDMAMDAADSAMSKVSEVAGMAQDKMHSTVDATRQTVRSMQDTLNDQMERQPLVIGAIAVAVGAVIGAALPRTQAENRLVGDSRDQFLQGAKDVTSNLRGRMAEAAKHSYQTAVDTAKEEGLLPDGDKSIAARIGAVAGAALDTATTEVETAVRGSVDEGREEEKRPSGFVQI